MTVRKGDMIRIVRNNPQRLDALTRVVPVTIKGDGPFEVMDVFEGNVAFKDDTGETKRVMVLHAEVVEDDKVTPDQLRDEMLQVFRGIAAYWANLPDHDKATGRDMTVLDRCEGVVFSMLSQLDGCGQLPAFDLVAHVHPEDEDQSLEGVTISDMLHEHF